MQCGFSFACLILVELDLVLPQSRGPVHTESKIQCLFGVLECSKPQSTTHMKQVNHKDL